jgi:hypothetical protein
LWDLKCILRKGNINKRIVIYAYLFTLFFIIPNENSIMNTTSKLIVLAVVAALMIAATTVVATEHQAFADTRQSGRCGSCQQNQATNGAELNTNGGQFNSR